MNSMLTDRELILLTLEHQESLLNGQRETKQLQENILAALEALGIGVGGIPPLLDKVAESNAALTNAVLAYAGDVINDGVEFD